MPAQSEQLEDTLEREDGDEHLVDVSQGARHRVRLVVVFSRHADHVHADDAHDGDLELLVRDDLEQQQLELDLYNEHAQLSSLQLKFHGSSFLVASSS